MKAAKKSKHPKHKMGAVVFSGSRVLSLAANGGRLGEHAEIRALKRASNTVGAHLAVVRVGGGSSQPCRLCYRMIKEAGIRRITFVDTHGKLVEQKTEELNEVLLRDYHQPRKESNNWRSE
jgi:tRNA(Arg) A34 adenosine deaminase TadA